MQYCRNYLLKEEVNKLFKALESTRDSLLFRLILETGCTVGETIGLRVKDILENKIRIPAECARNGKERTIDVSHEFLKTAREYTSNLEKESFILSTRQSQQMTARRVQQLCKYYQQKANLSTEITPYTLRYTKISNSLPKMGKEDIERSIGIKHISINDYLTSDEIKSIKKNIAEPRDRLLLDILYETGCTVSEASKLLVRDVEKSTLALQDCKNQRKRVLHLPPLLAGEIERFIAENHLNPDSFLFFSRQSDHITERRMQQLIKFYAKKAGISKDITPYTLRYSCIRKCIDSSMPVEKIQENLGIKNIALIARGLIPNA